MSGHDGMYAACTFEMARALQLEFLYVIPRDLVYVALLARAAAFLGLVRTLVGALAAGYKAPSRGGA